MRAVRLHGGQQEKCDEPRPGFPPGVCEERGEIYPIAVMTSGSMAILYYQVDAPKDVPAALDANLYEAAEAGVNIFDLSEGRVT